MATGYRNRGGILIEVAIHTTPPNATHRNVRIMAQAQGLSRMAAQRIWKADRLQPHRVETFKLSLNPQFVEKVRDAVGLYLNLPDKTLMLSVDEKSQIQAAGSHRATLAVATGHSGSPIARLQTPRSTTSFAILSVLGSKMNGNACRGIVAGSSSDSSVCVTV